MSTVDVMVGMAEVAVKVGVNVGVGVPGISMVSVAMEVTEVVGVEVLVGRRKGSNVEVTVGVAV